MTSLTMPRLSARPRISPPVRLALLMAAALLAVGILSVSDRHVFWNPLLCYDDVWVYYKDSFLTTQGHAPYRDFPLEYPPLALAAFLLPLVWTPGHSPSFPTYAWLLMATNVALTLTLALLLIRMPKVDAGGAATRLAWVTTLAILISPLLVWRYDIFPALLTLLALRAALGRRPALAGLWLGLGVAAKLYPIALAPVFLVYYWADEDRPALGRFLLGGIGALAATLLPFLTVGPQMLSVLRYHERRGLEIESLPGGLLLLAHSWAGLKVSVGFNYGAFHLASPKAALLLHSLPWVFGACVAAVLTGCLKSFRADKRKTGTVTAESLVLGCTAMLLAFMAANKVFSPQYLIWLLPFAPLLPRRAAWATVVITALTTIIYPFCFGDLLYLHAYAVALLTVRNGLVVALLVGLVAALCRPGRPSGIMMSTDGPNSGSVRGGAGSGDGDAGGAGLAGA